MSGAAGRERRKRGSTLVAVFLCAALAGCGEHEPPRPKVPPKGVPMDAKPLDESDERSSLIGLARGTSIIARSGEAFGPVSAMNAIDDIPGSFWLTPPHDLPQWVTLALPARSRLNRVGIRTVKGGEFTAKHVSFETSLDGAQWSPLTTVESADTNDAQWWNVAPAEARAVRVTIIDSAPTVGNVRLLSILAQGSELEAPQPGAIEGCWNINGMNAEFSAKGSQIRGALAMGKQPMELDGGSDERTTRLTWTRGNDYGLALVAVTPDGKHLSGMAWHEEAIPMFYADAWFGERVPCGPRPAPVDVPAQLMRRAGRYSAFGLRFDRSGALDQKNSEQAIATIARLIKASAGHVLIAGHEFRETSAKGNHERVALELDAVRKALAAAGVDVSHLPFFAAGSANPRQEPVTDAMRAIYSSIDVEIRR